LVAIAAGFICGAAFAINAFATRKINNEQDEAFRNLSPHALPPLTENVMESVFSVTNGSSKTTIESKTMYCGINQILGNKNGTPINISKLSTPAAVPNPSRLVPGDSRSDPCLVIWSQLVEKTECVDMSLWMQYTIESQPLVQKERWFRLVGYQARGGSFNWYPESTDSKTDYCDYFRRQITPKN
jgi:hypothetical protein